MRPTTSPTPNLTGPSAWLSALPAPISGQRRSDLDALRGIAIFLVVVGHVVAREMPAGNEWYAVLKDLIYRFHMPLFMMLTGMTFGLSVPMFRSYAEARTYSLRKSVRLAVPYLVFGLAILFGKVAASRYVHVDNLPEGSLADVVELFLVPARSAAGFLWFIYVLAIYLLVVPSLLLMLRRRPLALLLAAIAMQPLPWPQWFMLDRVVAYLPFYCLGIVLCLRRDLWTPLPASVGWPTVVVFAALLAAAYTLDVPRWVYGVLSLPVWLTLVQHGGETMRRFWGFIGVYSMSIYLMNTIVIGVGKGLMLNVHPWDGDAFLVYFPVLLLAGCVVPIIVKRWAEARVPRVARYL